MAVAHNISQPDPFQYDLRVRNTAGTRWPIWIAAFDTYIAASGVVDKAQKKAVLLHVVGASVVEIFNTLPNSANMDIDATKTALAAFFNPKKNKDFELFKFMSLRQEDAETNVDFAVRLQNAAKNCEFKTTEVDAEIKRQLIFGSSEKSCIRKLAFRETLDLTALMDKAKIVSGTLQNLAYGIGLGYFSKI